MSYLYRMGSQMFQKSKPHLKIQGARIVTWSKFYTEDSNCLRGNVQNSVARATWHLGLCTHVIAARSDLKTLFCALLESQLQFITLRRVTYFSTYHSYQQELPAEILSDHSRTSKHRGIADWGKEKAKMQFDSWLQYNIPVIYYKKGLQITICTRTKKAPKENTTSEYNDMDHHRPPSSSFPISNSTTITSHSTTSFEMLTKSLNYSYLGPKLPERKPEQPPPFSAEVQDAWSSSPLPHTQLCGRKRIRRHLVIQRAMQEVKWGGHVARLRTKKLLGKRPFWRRKRCLGGWH